MGFFVVLFFWTGAGQHGVGGRFWFCLEIPRRCGDSPATPRRRIEDRSLHSDSCNRMSVTCSALGENPLFSPSSLSEAGAGENPQKVGSLEPDGGAGCSGELRPTVWEDVGEAYPLAGEESAERRGEASTKPCPGLTSGWASSGWGGLAMSCGLASWARRGWGFRRSGCCHCPRSVWCFLAASRRRQIEVPSLPAFVVLNSRVRCHVACWTGCQSISLATAPSISLRADPRLPLQRIYPSR